MTKDLADELERLSKPWEALPPGNDKLLATGVLGTELVLRLPQILSALRGEWQGGVVGIVAYDLDYETITLRMNGETAVRRAYAAIPQANRAVFSERADG